MNSLYDFVKNSPKKSKQKTHFNMTNLIENKFSNIIFVCAIDVQQQLGTEIWHIFHVRTLKNEIKRGVNQNRYVKKRITQN